MCGIVCFFGQSDGVSHVLEALTLLEYRAPDSTGLSVIHESGHFSLSRSVGTPKKLIEHLQDHPLYRPLEQITTKTESFLKKQSLPHSASSLRDCSRAAGYEKEDLFRGNGIGIGRGDKGSTTFPSELSIDQRFSSKLGGVLRDLDFSNHPDFDLDPVRHAFRLLAAHVTSQVNLEAELQETLTARLHDRLPDKTYSDWFEAWQEETALNIPGHAFATAVRHFQETHPGLAGQITEREWGRMGGITARAMPQIVMGHGRWAMVGAVTAENTHPFLDRSRTRAVCENGSHNANLLLETRAQQKSWWRERGVPGDNPVHRSENTTEVIAFEWERAAHQIKSGDVPAGENAFLNLVKENNIADLEEQALRLCLWRLKEGNAHACSFHSLHHPGRLYISSHNKPIAIVRRSGDTLHQPLMVASDVNAALMLWPGPTIDRAAGEINELQKALHNSNANQTEIEHEIKSILASFQVEVIFLDHELTGGEELLARIENTLHNGEIHPTIQVTKYDGSPIRAKPQTMNLNPSLVGKGGYPSYTEFHISEIPQVMERIQTRYLQDGNVHLASTRAGQDIYTPGLNEDALTSRFGARLESLERILLLGEGSSWRDAKAVFPLFQSLLQDIATAIYHPVEVLNLGKSVNPQADLALEISWSGTTDSVLKTDGWLDEQGLLRLGITGRPQSDLGRRTAGSAGTLDVQSGVEISVATVKGFEAILMTLNLVALRFAEIRDDEDPRLRTLRSQLGGKVVTSIRDMVKDDTRRKMLGQVAERCRSYNKVAVVGNSPICIEGELKIEELAQILACPFGFHDVSLRSLMEHSALAEDDRHRTLFLLNATTPEAISQAQPLIRYLHALDVFSIIHTIESNQTQGWRELPQTAVFTSSKVHPYFQPLIDAPFFFDFAVALAYARQLTPGEVDRPRNLAKSVTTTGAEKRHHVESRQEFNNITLEAFSAGPYHQQAWGSAPERPLKESLHINLPMRTAIAVLNNPLPRGFETLPRKYLLLVADSEATENAAHMAGAVWQELLGIEITVYRQPLEFLPPASSEEKCIYFNQEGAYLTVVDGQTINLPIDLSPLQLELLGSVYLMSLAIRLARQQGHKTHRWEKGVAQLPFLLTDLLASKKLRGQVAEILEPYVNKRYDKAQIIGGGQDYAAAKSIARSLRTHGFMAEALYTDSAWHGPLAAVGGPDAEHDALTVILATDPLFQPAAMVDTQVYRTRNAPVILVVPEGNEGIPAVEGVEASAILTLPPLPRAFVPIGNVALGAVIAEEMEQLWAERPR